MSYSDLWNHIDGNGIEGLEAFVGDVAALDIVTYLGSGEWSWMLREGDAGSTRVTASYDDDLYYATADEALFALMDYLKSSRPDVHSALESHPVRDSLKGFCQKALRCGFALTLSVLLGVGLVGAVSPAEQAYALDGSSMSLGMAAANGNIAQGVGFGILFGNAKDSTQWQNDLVDAAVLDGYTAATDQEAIDWFESFCGNQYDSTFGEGYMYLLQNQQGEHVALSFSDGTKMLCSNPEIVGLLRDASNRGDTLIHFDSIQINGEAARSMGMKSTAHLANAVDEAIPRAFLFAIGGIAILFIGFRAYASWRENR